MYCINCGVKLADTESACPLCGTRVYHPDIPRRTAPSLYPSNRMPALQKRSKSPMIFATAAFLLAATVCVLSDWQLGGGIVWSGYVVGALLMLYVGTVLPSWFEKPNPVVFVPSFFAAVIVYLLYINWNIDGDWFLSFAFPVAGGIGVIVTAVVALLYYTKNAVLFIVGGGFAALGAFMLLIEFLLCLTFESIPYIWWSLYPLVTFVLLGGLLIFLAINRTAREVMERKFFI